MGGNGKESGFPTGTIYVVISVRLEYILEGKGEEENGEGGDR